MGTRQGKMNAGSGDVEKRRRANMGKKGGKRVESERYQEKESEARRAKKRESRSNRRKMNP